MKILISADMEGATCVTWPADCEPGAPEWQRCRSMFTSDVNGAVAGFFDGGATEVLINEAHATMRNLLLEELDERATMLTGRHKDLTMVEGIQHGDVDGAEFGVNQEFRALNNELHGQEPGEDEANGFTVGEVVADAVEAVGCAEQGDCQQQLVDYIRATEFDTIVGPLSFDETGKPQSAHMILQWQSDNLEIVLPEDPEVQTADLQHPKAPW